MKIRYFSMFSGIGGFELGIGYAGLKAGLETECVGFSEIDRHAIGTYKEHFPEHRNFGDATGIDTADVPDFDLLVAGFPCQAFSTAGRRLGFEDTRGTLFFDVARMLAAKRPRYFILENVRGLYSHEGGRTFRTILETLTSLRYSVCWQLLNSADFGVPQSRHRVYLVGHLGGFTRPPVLPFAGGRNPYSTVGESPETAVSRTYTAGGKSGGHHSGMTVIIEQQDPLRMRRLTPIEAERLQGFPDGWTWGSHTSRYRQIGNAVTVNVVEAICDRLFEGLGGDFAGVRA